VIGPSGPPALVHNAPAMARAWVTPEGSVAVAL